MHKKGITEEVAKKRSRRTVKHQRGIVGADMSAIIAKRNQTSQQRTDARLAAIKKAKNDKKDKEAKKEKAKVRFCDTLAVGARADVVTVVPLFSLVPLVSLVRRFPSSR